MENFLFCHYFFECRSSILEMSKFGRLMVFSVVTWYLLSELSMGGKIMNLKIEENMSSFCSFLETFEMTQCENAKEWLSLVNT